MPIKFTNEIIIAAIEGFEAKKRRIDEQIGELRAMLSGGSTDRAATPSVQPKPKRKRRLSAAGRKAISDASRRRWATVKAAKQTAEKATSVKKAAHKRTAAKAAAQKAVKTAPRKARVKAKKAAKTIQTVPASAAE